MSKIRKITQTVKAEIIDHLFEGETLTAYFVKKKPPFTRRALYKVINEDPVFAAEYKLARELGADKISEDILSIVDNENLSVASRRLMASYRLKMLSTWFPKVYGKQGLPSGSEDPSLDHLNQDELQLELNKRLLSLGLEVVHVKR